jgi:hypothetical protein
VAHYDSQSIDEDEGILALQPVRLVGQAEWTGLLGDRDHRVMAHNAEHRAQDGLAQLFDGRCDE